MEVIPSSLPGGNGLSRKITSNPLSRFPGRLTVRKAGSCKTLNASGGLLMSDSSCSPSFLNRRDMATPARSSCCWLTLSELVTRTGIENFSIQSAHSQ